MQMARTKVLRWAIGVLAVGFSIGLVWKLTRFVVDGEEAVGVDDELSWGGGAADFYRNRPIPVAVNRTTELADGFRGDVHPLLHAQTRLSVTALWTPIGLGRSLHYVAPPAVYAWYTSLRPARPQQVYTERDFSGFMPAAVGDVGQLWALDSAKVVKFLKQFHPHASLHLVALGRRAGPEGAFAVLRGLSPTHLDIAFRIHAEFYVTPGDCDPFQPTPAWYTPAYFSGRMVVNKQTGTVEYFELGLPTEKTLNVFLTVVLNSMGRTTLAPDVVRVERMELSGGNASIGDRITWTNTLSTAEANRRLARVFYRFMDLDWRPFDQALAEARRQDRKIFAVVSWGSFDDQSC